MTDPMSRFSPAGKVVAVTGAASGMGRSIAFQFARAGASVVAFDYNAEGAEATATSIAAEGGACVAHVGDVSRRGDVEGAIARAETEFGGLDVVVNAAGVIRPASLAELTDEDFDSLIDIHLKGALYGTQAALGSMRRTGTRGLIVNFVSSAIDRPAPGYAAYTVAKAGIAALTKVAAIEAGSDGIRVNAIAPGVIRTNMGMRHGYDASGRFDPERLEKFYDSLAAQTPLQMVGDPEDVALLVMYLASDAARFITGQTWRINGGSEMPW